MTETKEMIQLLKTVRDSPPLNDQGNAVVVDGKMWRRIADLLSTGAPK